MCSTVSIHFKTIVKHMTHGHYNLQCSHVSISTQIVLTAFTPDLPAIEDELPELRDKLPGLALLEMTNRDSSGAIESHVAST
jgi:hypothetical protein